MNLSRTIPAAVREIEMTDVQVWCALALALTYIVGKAAAHVAETRRDRHDTSMYRAETLLEHSVAHVCDSVYAAYVAASETGELSDEQVRDIMMRAEMLARQELSFEGHKSLDALLSPRMIGREMRARLDRYVREFKKEGP
jgi:hypothetical protein